MSSPLVVADEQRAWPAAAAPARVSAVAKVTASTKRDLRIDFLRGLFILTLAGTHFTWFAHMAGYRSPVRFYDSQPAGFSSAAEFFVFFSGYILALVINRNYERVGFFRATARCVHRAWQLYMLNVFTFAVVVAGASFLFVDNPELARASRMALARGAGLSVVGQFLTFRGHLSFFEILWNYIFFIPLVPLALELARRVPVALPLLSVGLWLLNQTGLAEGWHFGNFCPLAWQLVFFAGCYVGAKRSLADVEFPHKKLQTVAFFVLIVAMAAVKLALHRRFGDIDIPGTSKIEMGPLRVFHFAVMFWGAMLLLPSAETLRRFRLADTIAGVGRNSLECFCFANVLVYYGAQLFIEAGSSLASYLVMQASVFTLVLLGARLFEWFKSEPWRR
jgi:hypothetical protein